VRVLSKRDEIKSQLQSLGIRKSWLAEQLGIKSSVLSMLLNEGEEFDNELYLSIKNIIESYQYDLGLADEHKEENEPSLFDSNLKQGISNRLRIFAKRKYGTLKNLADAMDISPQQLQQYVGAKREPGAKILSKLLKAGCDINWLLGGSESIESYKVYKLEMKLRNYKTELREISKIISDLENKSRGL